MGNGSGSTSLAILGVRCVPSLELVRRMANYDHKTWSQVQTLSNSACRSSRSYEIFCCSGVRYRDGAMYRLIALDF